MDFLSEAFKRLNVLNEETFDLSINGEQTELKDFLDNDEEIDTVTIIDDEAETEDELKDSYIGKVVLDCNVCHSLIYKDPKDVFIDDEQANIDEECPYCFSSGDGFKVVGQIRPFTKDEIEELDDEEEDSEEDIEDVEEQEDIDLEESICSNKAARKAKIRKKLSELFDIDASGQTIGVGVGGGTGISQGGGLNLPGLGEGIECDLSIGDDVYITDKAVTEDYFLDDDEELNYIGSDGTLVGFGGPENAYCIIEYSDGARFTVPSAYVKCSWESESFDESVCPECGKNPCECECDDMDEDLGIGAGLALGGAALGAGILGSKLVDSLDEAVVFDKDVFKNEALNEKLLTKPNKNATFDRDGFFKVIERATKNYTQKSGEMIGYFKFTTDLAEKELKKHYTTVTREEQKLDKPIDSRIPDGKGKNILINEIAVLKYSGLKENTKKKTNESIEDDYYPEVGDVLSLTINASDWDGEISRDYHCTLEFVGTEDEFFFKFKPLNDDAIEFAKFMADYEGYDYDGYFYQQDEGFFDDLGDGYKVLKSRNSTKIDESIENLSLDTEDTHLEMATDGDEITIKTKPIDTMSTDWADDDFMAQENDMVEETPDETIGEVDLETELEIENNDRDAEEADVEDEEEISDEDEDEDDEVEVDEFDEDSFNELGESYLKKVYENVKSFKCKSAADDGNKMFIEGVITFNSGNKKKTKFVFENKGVNKYGKTIFEGFNKEIARGNKSFTLNGAVKGNKIVCESLSYRYNQNKKKISGKVSR